jgi:hypothetical protein
MDEYISGEKHRAMATPRPSRELPKNYLLLAVIAVVLLGVGFMGGSAYQKSKQPKVSSATSGSSSFAAGAGGRTGGGRFGGQRPVSGQVTAVSSSSITIQTAASTSPTTLAITSSTQITNNNQPAVATDIAVGDTVLVVENTTDKTQADRIMVNPSFGGGQGMAPAPASN